MPGNLYPKIMPNKNGRTVTGIIAFLFFFAVILPFIISHLSLEISLILVLACVVFIIAFINTDIALIIVILSMLLSPELKTGGISDRPVIIRSEDILLLAIFVGWLAKTAVNKELGILKANALNKPIIVYIFICILSSLLGILQGHINFKSSVFYVLKYIEYSLLFFMVVNNLRSVKQAKMFVFFILLTCFLVCIYAMLRLPTGERLSAPFEEGGEPNTFAAYLLLMMGLLIGFILHPESIRQRFVSAALFVFTVAIFVLTLSRGGWLGFFPMLVTVVILNKRFRLPLLLILILAILVLPYILPAKVHKRINETFAPEKTYTVFGKRYGFSESAAARIDSWKVGFQRWAKEPVLGYGIPVGSVIDNQFTRVLAETGTVGFMVFGWLMITIFRLSWRTYAGFKDNDFAQAVSLGLIAGFVGLLVQSLTAAVFILIRVMEPFWFLTAIVVMLPEIINNDGVQTNE